MHNIPMYLCTVPMCLPCVYTVHAILLIYTDMIHTANSFATETRSQHGWRSVQCNLFYSDIVTVLLVGPIHNTSP